MVLTCLILGGRRCLSPSKQIVTVRLFSRRGPLVTYYDEEVKLVDFLAIDDDAGLEVEPWR
jgi:hypothetical protein